MSDCKCRELEHKPERLQVGDEVCLYCSQFLCCDTHLPVWGTQKAEFIKITGKPDGCGTEVDRRLLPPSE